MHEAMDVETVAGLLGVSTRQIRTYVAQADMPSTQNGRTRTFNWAEVLEWYVGYRAAIDGGDRVTFDEDGECEEAEPQPGKKEDIRQANLRKTRAEADLKELALSEKRAEVIPISDAKVRLDRMFGNFRAKLLSIGPKLANRLEGTKTRTERETVIKDEMETLCREISTGAIVDLPKDEPAPLEELNASADEDEIDLTGEYDFL